MKVKRQKNVKKYLSLFKNTFGIFEPFQILIDGTFCQAALQNKINIKEQLSKYLDAEIQLLTTDCVQTELDSLGGTLYGALVIAKRFKARKCGHTKNVPATECVSQLIGVENKKRYFVATQDKHLRSTLRKVPGVPLLYINYNCIVLEKPSVECCKKASEIQVARTQPSGHEKESLDRLKSYIDESEIKKCKRKRPKGPNPLSCKKKKKTRLEKSCQESSSRKRRKKRKIPVHVMEALLDNM